MRNFISCKDSIFPEVAAHKNFKALWSLAAKVLIYSEKRLRHNLNAGSSRKPPKKPVSGKAYRLMFQISPALTQAYFCGILP